MRKFWFIFKDKKQNDKKKIYQRSYMKTRAEHSNISDFKWRKIVHYSLIISIILIQIAIAGFLYNEFLNKKNVNFIEDQLKEMSSVEDLTDDSKKELYNAQNSLQKYSIDRDPKDLESYFRSVNKLSQNLEFISNVKDADPYFKKIIISEGNKTLKPKDLKALIDSTYQISSQVLNKGPKELPKLNKFEVKYKLEIPEIEMQTFSDTIKKKGMFGRLKDAITGKENVRKDSTVIIFKNKNKEREAKLQAELDSVINIVNSHYLVEVQKIKVIEDRSKIIEKNSNRDTSSMFSKLLGFSNKLTLAYEIAVKRSKSDLEKELKDQNSKTNTIRNYLIIGLLALMFLVSILIMYFTRMAFVYEKKLNVANEQITENLNFKNRILGMLSHELRSPLKIIGLFINRIKNKTDDLQIKEYLRAIRFTNDTLLMQANQILEYTKNQHVENKLIVENFNLNNEIDAILNAIEPYIETRNNQFNITQNIDPNMVVNSDRTKINQIFINILGNANKFTENGKIFVQTSLKNGDQNFITLDTTIRDNGVGISQADLQEIFEPYYQGILSDGIENLGAGLGLSLCKEIIELFNGTISVESELGKGTTVNFRINLNIANESTK